MDIETGSEMETAELARRLASGLRAPDLVFLSGDLGSGKTVFARALIRALCGEERLEVPSPTFTLVQTYDGPIHHYDLYRLEKPEEIYELGWEDSLAEGLTIVEWPERLGALMPPSRLEIRFENIPGKPSSRRIIVKRMDAP